MKQCEDRELQKRMNFYRFQSNICSVTEKHLLDRIELLDQIRFGELARFEKEVRKVRKTISKQCFLHQKFLYAPETLSLQECADLIDHHLIQHPFLRQFINEFYN